MIDRLWHLPPRIRIRVQDINPETGRQRNDPETGERLWTHEDVNVLLYTVGLIYMLLSLLVYLLRDELRAARSPAYRSERERRWVEIVERKMKQRERYKQKRGMWRNLVERLGLDTAAPASEDAIAGAEHVVNCRLTESLRALLREMNGVRGEYGLEVVRSAERIAQENQQMRTIEAFAELYMPFEPLLFFGASEGGDLFAFGIRTGRARSPCNGKRSGLRPRQIVASVLRSTREV